MNPRPKRLFYSFLAPRLQAYLTFKQKLGYTSFANPYTAADLDRYILFRGLSSLRELDEGFVAQWLHSTRLAPATKNGKLHFVTGFFSHLIRVGLARHNPARRIPRFKTKPYKPHLYSLLEIHRLLEQARRLQCRHPHALLGATIETLIFLLYACGLRISEALRVKLRDVDFEENTLSLWNTKFHKERLVPFSRAVNEKLRVYLALRLKLYPPRSSDAPFFCHAKGGYHRIVIYRHFRKLLSRCGLAKLHGRGGPRLHDLRHAMASHRLYKWYQEGHDILNKLPLLSTYLGHVNIENTQVYLSVTQALLREGDRRFQRACEELAGKNQRRLLKKS